MQATQRPSGLHFRLRDFEGPLDLLLFLVGENELDIWDIPIVSITRQYQDWMNEIGDVDLDAAGDYILMSATLLQIKARMLLPQETQADQDVEDPRLGLVQRLLEYQHYRELSRELAGLEVLGRELWPRRFFTLDWLEPGIRDETLDDIRLFDLACCHAELCGRKQRSKHHDVELFPFTVDDQIRRIRDRLKTRAVFPLTGLGNAVMDRPMLVISFLAILDLMRNQEIQARQVRGDADIWVFNPQQRENWLCALRDLA